VGCVPRHPFRNQTSLTAEPELSCANPPWRLWSDPQLLSLVLGQALGLGIQAEHSW
jgi:hypothetical protein